MELSAYAQPIIIAVQLCLFLCTVHTSLFVSGSTIWLGSSDKYINMEDYMACRHCYNSDNNFWQIMLHSIRGRQ